MQATSSSSPVRAPALPVGVRGQYQLADTSMTLREGLADYYRVNPGLSVPAEIKDESSARYFHNHDTTHVVFGTHTGLLDEAVNDTLTFLGVDIRARDYITGFTATDESRKIAKSAFSWAIIPALWQALRLLPRIWRMTRAMKKKWPWAPPEAWLDRPLQEIRQEFGIEPIAAEAVLARGR